MNQINTDEFIEQLKSYFNLNTDEDLAARLDMTQPAITHWRRRGIPRKILRKYKTLISGAGEKVVVAEQPIHIQKGNKQVNIENNKDTTSLEASYIIDLQRDKIKQQEKEIAMYKDYVDRQPLQKLQFDDITEDMSSTVEVRNVFSLKPMERKMVIGKGGEKLEKALGLPKGHGYFAPNEWFTMDSHPVDAIMAKDTLNELKGITKTLPSLFESLKFMVGNHYMSFPVIYEYKNKRVRTMCSILLDWTSSPKRILTKTVILNGRKD